MSLDHTFEISIVPTITLMTYENDDTEEDRGYQMDYFDNKTRKLLIDRINSNYNKLVSAPFDAHIFNIINLEYNNGKIIFQCTAKITPTMIKKYGLHTQPNKIAYIVELIYDTFRISADTWFVYVPIIARNENDNSDFVYLLEMEHVDYVIIRSNGEKKTNIKNSRKTRKSPAESATAYNVGMKKKGGDGNMWTVKTVKVQGKNTKRWFKT